MRPIIKDSATPKTGGIINRANPTVASRFVPARRDRDLSFGFPPICRGVLCETNPISVEAPNLRTMEHPPRRTNHQLRTKICETNPIYARPKCKTNPIYRTADLSPTRPTTQLHETNPISAYPASRHPKNAKRTQFHPPACRMPHASCLVPQFHETNPISRTASIPKIYNPQSTIYNLHT